MLFSTGLSQVVVIELQQWLLFSTDLSQVVDTELQQCCFQQLATDLLQTEESAL
jgi:hypothetical protein